jgi:UDP-2,4-diacetamido-2,4,6-trideoxy-beta-L-altropyranose hydrolase
MQLDNKIIKLRPAGEEDCRLLWEWANDPVVRTYAFSSNPIPWEEHLQWFSQKLSDPQCYIFMAIDFQDRPIGQVRFDALDEQRSEIDISIAADRRGLGYGKFLIEIASNELFYRTSIRAIHAFIKPNNYASIRTFEKAKFNPMGEKTVKGNLALHYIRKAEG